MTISPPFSNTLVLAVLVCFGFVVSVMSQTSDTPPTSGSTIPTLWLVGDSTVKVGTPGQQGWGDPIQKWFDPTKIRVENRARGGRSSRTYQTEGLWDKVLQDAKPGDFVIIQMGHNDGGPLSGDNRERGSLRGIGDETQEVELVLQNNKKEVVHTYGWYLRKYIQDARNKGLTPIICSPIPRCPKPGEPVQPAGEPSGYRLWAKQIAEQENAPFIDLQALILQKYTQMTPEQIKAKCFTPADNTHTSPEGAELNAQAVVEGIRQLHDVPLASYLKASTESK